MIDIRSFRDLLRLFYIFRREFLIAFGLTVVFAVGIAFLMPPKYASEARLLVKPGRENLTVPLDAGDRQTMMSQVSQRDPIIDEEKMLTGRPVVNQVARLYIAEMANQPPPEGVWKTIKAHVGKAALALLDGLRWVTTKLGLTEQQSAEERLAVKLADKFQAAHGPGSNVMELRFVWDDPLVAQRIMQTWVKVYMDERTTVLGRKGLVVFYEGKVRDADQQIESTKALWRARLEKIQGISASERIEALTKRVNELRTRRAEILAEKDATEQGLNYASGRAKSLPREVVSEREMGYGPTWLALSNQLSELKRQRSDALRVYKETAPTIVSLNESIATLEKQVQAEERNVQRSERRTPNELGATLERNQLEKSVRLRELITFSSVYDKEIGELEAARRQVLESEPELARLEQELAVAEKGRALYLDSLEKARIDQALDENRINNIAQIEQATFNPARVSPKSLLLLLLAAPAGLMVGLLVVYLRSLMDQRIHDGGRVEQRFGVPLWSTIKDITGNGGEDNEFHASLYRIYGMLPFDRLAEQGLTVGLTSSRPKEGVSFIAQRLRTLLQAQGLRVRLNVAEGEPDRAQPGEVLLLEAAGLLSNREAFVRLSRADMIVLVVEARASTVPVVENALGVLRTAFHKVDGVIINRRRFEVPPHVLRWLQR
ncbi:lipopolysaccharide biosynthesis protein [Aquabacterium soli]|uniref:Lipopolysaccharide biosynthesis protein n=1 Tax=Aquabacterium soli TaxID=2493092 RepID=A0A3R8S2J0_9BURK|nr:lipopolysaccharide biosynthesis protein [Aquabacterium soli]RRS03964.1 lipopolysaccharide biosynthesis protein [Aquabacterium soli]